MIIKDGFYCYKVNDHELGFLFLAWKGKTFWFHYDYLYQYTNFSWDEFLE